MRRVPIPSLLHHGIAGFVLFFGCMAALGAVIAWGLAGAAAFLPVAVAFFVIRAWSGSIVLHDEQIEIVASPLWKRRRLDLPRSITLEHKVLRRGKSKKPVWEVGCAGGWLARAPGLHEARSIAETLARTLHVPLQGDLGDGAITIAPEDLDLPLTARLEKYPRLRVDREPETRPFAANSAAGGVRELSWRAFSTGGARGVLIVMGAIWLFMTIACFLPGKRGPSPVSQHGTVVPIAVAAIIATITVAVLVGMSLTRLRVTLERDHIARVLSFAAIPIAGGEIPYHEIEEVRVLLRTSVAVSSDARTFTLWTWRTERESRWLAAELQRELVERAR